MTKVERLIRRSQHAREARLGRPDQARGDVLVGWEDDTNLAVRQLGRDKLEIVLPSITIVAEPVVAMV